MCGENPDISHVLKERGWMTILYYFCSGKEQSIMITAKCDGCNDVVLGL
jgi:hypothetical protein